jgi:hypothetical protein
MAWTDCIAKSPERVVIVVGLGFSLAED